MTTSELFRAATYRRVSTSQQKDGTSPETQLARAHALIERTDGWAHHHEWDFADLGVSGAKQSRADLDRLFEFCRHGMLDVVVVGDLSRLSRDMRHSLNFEHELEQLGVKVIDADNPNADELARMFTYLQGHWQRAQIRKATHRGILAVAEAGYWPGGRPPFGWRIAPATDHPKRKVAVRDDREAETVELAVRMILGEGFEKPLSCWEAVQQLNATGHRTREGDRWSVPNLARMLRRDSLAGEWAFRADAGSFTIRGPQIIAPERLRRVRQMLAERARAWRPTSHVYPLSGRVVGLCRQTDATGRPVTYHGTYRNDRDLRQYECSTNNAQHDGTGRRCWCPVIQADWLEATVWAEVTTLLSDPERLLALAEKSLARRRGELHAEAVEISDLERRLAAAKRQRTNIVLAEAATGPEAIAGALAEVTADIDKLEAMRAQARAWAAANAERATLVRDLGRLAEAAREVLADPTLEEQREVFARLDVRVQLTDRGVRVRPGGVRPALQITGMLVGDLAELGTDLGNPASRSRTGS
jgi:DNA invertase Pin-like site-specific DNA recombinase